MAQLLSRPIDLPAFTVSSPPMPEAIMDSSDSTTTTTQPFCFPVMAESRAASDPFPPDLETVKGGCPMDEAGGDYQDVSPRRHNQKPKSAALPSFSFNPGESPPPSPPAVPLAEPNTFGFSQSSPRRSRSHRRAASERIKDTSHWRSAARSQSPDNPARDETYPSTLPIQPSAPRMGHRHRRSAALSSQDLSATARQTATEALRVMHSVQPAHARPLVSSLESSASHASSPDPFNASSLKNTVLSNASSKTPSPSRVSFSENVDIIPSGVNASHVSARLNGVEEPLRPRSAESALTGSRARRESSPRRSRDDLDIARVSEDTVTGVSFASCDRPVLDSLDPSWSLVDSQAEHSERGRSQPQLADAEAADTDSLQDPHFSNFNGTVELSEDFDDDPTSAFVTDMQRSMSLPILKPATCILLGDSRADSEDSLVDIDDAMNSDGLSAPKSQEELKSLRGKGFSAARKSLHSGGLTSGFAGSALHRRTESAPGMLDSEFKRPVLDRLNDASASEKGFQMNNVFEEDEDDGTPPSPCTRDVTPASLPVTMVSVDDEGQQRSSTTSTLKSLMHVDTSAEKSRSCEPSSTSMISAPSTPDQHHGSRASSSYGQTSGSCFGTPQTDVTSSFSDTRRPSAPKFFNAVAQPSDSAPSLISSQSTTQRLTSSNTSPAFPPASMSADSTPSIPSAGIERRKRSSIASLSRLMSVPNPGRSNLLVSQTARFQTSDGLEPRVKEKRSKRISKLLKFWKPKDTD